MDMLRSIGKQSGESVESVLRMARRFLCNSRASFKHLDS